MSNENRGSSWSVTINNPTESDYEELNRARQKGWRVEGQLEKGAEGTYHLQLMVKTPQVRFSAVKKAFSRAHIEIARNAAALASYVNKEDTRVATLPQGSDTYPSLSKLWELVAVKMNAGHREWTCDDKDGFDGLSSPDDRRAMYYSTDKDARAASNPLEILDSVAEDLIAEGYHIESMVANPSVRSAWRKFWRSICFRAIETARQTDARLIMAEVNVPTVHNHAPNVHEEEDVSEDEARSSQGTPEADTQGSR